MKTTKLLLAGAFASFLLTISTFGQGQFNFSSSARFVWDDWSGGPGVFKADNTNNVAFLFGTGTPLVDSIMTSVPTNYNPIVNGVFNPSQAWTLILSDPNFHLATNTVTQAEQVDTTTIVGGAVGSTFVATNSPASGTITVYVIAWSNAYANAVAAAAAGSVVGWSAPFTYTIGSPPGTTANPFTSAPNTGVPFGVAITPEPTTLALMGLGSAALLIFRRKKS